MNDSYELKKKLLNLLDKFVAVCEKFNLQYYLSSGSVIGAIRHGGMIPWDDDIDLYMPRADYERLQQLPKTIWGDAMELTSWKLTPKNQYHFLKLEDKNTTIIEQLEPLYVGGIYLDIFPLDGVPSDSNLFKTQLREIDLLWEKYYTLCVRMGCQYKGLVNIIKFHIKRFLYKREQIQDQWDYIAQSSNSTNNQLYYNYHSVSGWRGNPMPMEWFGHGRKVQFDGRMVLVPQEAEKYLQRIFGDYMTPPPVEERVGHEFYYINIKERVSEHELKQIISQLKHKTAFHWCIKDEIKYWQTKYNK